MKGVVFTSSGITSWGDTWEWLFGGCIELKAPDGHTLLVTDLHTLESDDTFEDELYDRDFSMSSAQDDEWRQICWDCYLAEVNIYGVARQSFRTCISRLVQKFKATKPDVTSLTDEEYVDMYADCLDAIKNRLDWNGDELEWLFNYDGPMSAAVDEWLTAFLEKHGLRVTD